MKKKFVLFVLIMAFVLSSVPLMANDLDDLRAQYAEAQAEVQMTEAELAAISAEMQYIHDTIMELDIRLSEATDNLINIEAQLDTTTELFEQIEIEWEEAQAALERQNELVRDRLREIQMQGTTGMLSVVFQATSLRDFLLRVEYVNNIARRDQEMIALLEANIVVVQQMQDTFARHLDAVEYLQEQQEGYILQLEDMEEEKWEFIYALVADEDRYMALLAMQQQAADEMREKVDAEVARIEAERVAAARAAANARDAEVARAIMNNDADFAWPAPGFTRISSNFGYRNHPTRRRREHHDGIDLASARGNRVLAAEAGTVILSSWHGGYGQTVIIDHGNGLHTLYAHNSRNIVRVGDRVTRGQHIAYIGSTGVSTGPHLHFEVRVNGRPTNPRPFLGI